MTTQRRQPPDDPSSAPESGTVRDDTSGNNPADRGNAGQPGTERNDTNRQDQDRGRPTAGRFGGHL